MTPRASRRAPAAAPRRGRPHSSRASRRSASSTPAVFSIVEHPSGFQVKAGDWPLYTFAGDSAPGDTNGQGSGGIWFVVAPDGSLIES